MKKKIIFKVSIILVVLASMVGIVYGVGRSFGFFKYVKKGDIVNIITIGDLKNAISITILTSDSDKALDLNEAYPMYDSEGMDRNPFEFEATSNIKKAISFSLKIENDEEKQSSCTTIKNINGVETTVPCPKLSTEYIRYSYSINDGEYVEPKNLSESNDIVIDSYSLASKDTVKISLKIWIDSGAGNEIQGHYFAGKLILSQTDGSTGSTGSGGSEGSGGAGGTGYVETLLNGTDPVISGGLVPVTIDANGVVKKADRSQEWYNYGNKEWANAVITFSGNDYENEATIPESDIKQYYVWVPRYRYQLWNVGSKTLSGDTSFPNGTQYESAINIIFEDKNTTAPSTGSNNGEWLTHPAFTNFDTNGIWVGKFESSYNENTYTNSSVFVTTNPNVDAVTSGSNIIIKPNVRSLVYKDVSTLYTLGRGVNSNLNSHMMTNMEWGAAAYLTYSLYGKCTTSGCEEVYINNVGTGYGTTAPLTPAFSDQWQLNGSITGCSGASTSADPVINRSSCDTDYAWNEVNNKASTTGNVTGIYDMRGGSWEYVMATIKDESGKPMSGRNNNENSGFNGPYGCPTCEKQSVLEKTGGVNFPTDSRYYNLYTPYSYTAGDDTWYIYTTGMLGDATKEISYNKDNVYDAYGLWYMDVASFPTPSYPWLARGGDFRSRFDSGIFGFSRALGSMKGEYGFRVTLAL